MPLFLKNEKEEKEMQRAILLDDGSRYLEVGYRVADFRKAYPKGRIETKVVHMEQAFILIKAEIFDEDKKIAESYGMRWYTETEPYFTEVAETIAIGRALSDIGFNLFSMELKDKNPMDMAIELDDGKKYLNVGYRVAWFHRNNPKCVIEKELLRMERNYAVMRVTVTTADGIVLTTAHARRDWHDNENGGHFFVESAETAAVGRAMSNLGYDLPMEINAEHIDNNAFADMPLGRNQFQPQQTPFSARSLENAMPEHSANSNFFVPQG